MVDPQNLSADAEEIKATIQESRHIKPTNLIKNPSSPWTALKEPMKAPEKIKFICLILSSRKI